jgi:hypothetical protein
VLFHHLTDQLDRVVAVQRPEFPLVVAAGEWLRKGFASGEHQPGARVGVLASVRP